MATASDPAPAERMEELLACCICGEILDEPKTLPCFHSFCKKCLARYIEVQREKAERERDINQNMFDCPLCRTQFELKQGDSVEQIPPNYFINNMLEILPVIQQQTQKLHCDSCEARVTAKCRCIDCERYLCKNCLATHNKWPDFRQHVVMTLEELAKPENQSKAKAKPRCQKHGHRNKPLQFYCNTCRELSCINCVVLDHPKSNHNYEPTDQVAELHKKVLCTTSHTLQRTFEEVQNALGKIDQATRNLEVNSKTTKDMILQQEKEILQEFTQKLKQTTALLLDEVDKEHETVNQKLVEQHDDMKAYHEKVHGSLEFAKNIIERASNDEILLLGTEIQINANSIKKECPKIMEPIHDGVIEYQAKSIKSIVGNINMTNIGNLVSRPLKQTRRVKVPRFLRSFKKHVVPRIMSTQTSEHVNTMGQSISERSLILKGNLEHAKQLVEWVEDQNFRWQLCYRASRDGWKAEDFHRQCDDVGPTLTLVKCGTSIFGGFTDQSWKSTNVYPEFKPSHSSFLFSLKNIKNVWAFKCPIKDDKNCKAICCNPRRGAVFGDADLLITNDANANQYSISNLGDTYQPPPGYQPGAEKTKALLAGGYEFTPSEIEVFRN